MVDCKACNGKGLDPADFSRLCAVCKGSGHVVSEVKLATEAKVVPAPVKK